MSTSLPKEVIQLADNYRYSDIILALALIAARDTRQMMTDFIADPDYLKIEGLPTRDKMVDATTDFAIIQHPMQLGESTFGVGYSMETGERFLDFAIRVAIDKVYEAQPDLLRLTFDAGKNVAKSD